MERDPSQERGREDTENRDRMREVCTQTENLTHVNILNEYTGVLYPADEPNYDLYKYNLNYEEIYPEYHIKKMFLQI